MGSAVESDIARAISAELGKRKVESTIHEMTGPQPLDGACTTICYRGLLHDDVSEPSELIRIAEKFDVVILLHGTTDNEAVWSNLKGCGCELFHVITDIRTMEDSRYIERATRESKVYSMVSHVLGERSHNGIHDFSSLVSDLAKTISKAKRQRHRSCPRSNVDSESAGLLRNAPSDDGQSVGLRSVNLQSVETQSVNPATSAFFSSVHEALQRGRVNIAVVGLPGVGKSVFAEALKVVIKACNDIELTIVEVTDEPLHFSLCSEQINIWDLPGVDEKKAHWRLYVKVASQCDAVIFLHGTRIMEVDQKVLKDLNGYEGPGARPQIFHVRSRIDSEAKAARRRPPAGVAKEEAEGKALEEIREYIKTATGVPRAYMVCALEPDDENDNDIYNWWNWDFKALARDLAEEIKAVESRRVEESGGGREVS